MNRFAILCCATVLSVGLTNCADDAGGTGGDTTGETTGDGDGDGDADDSTQGSSSTSSSSSGDGDTSSSTGTGDGDTSSSTGTGDGDGDSSSSSSGGGGFCGDGMVDVDEECDGEVANGACDQCLLSCDKDFDNCNQDLVDGCEADLLTDELNCGGCGDGCMDGFTCFGGSCGQPDEPFDQYDSENRTVYLYKSPKCAILDQYETFCEDQGLFWWAAKSQADAQQLIDFAFALDNWHTWIQVFGASTVLNSQVDGYDVTVDSGDCVEASNDGWTAWRQWGCSFCDPESNQQQQNDGESCCWDKDHEYDWFVCES